jgi:hypothetical protein
VVDSLPDGQLSQLRALLDSGLAHSYLRPIPIHRLTGGAFVRASAFRLEGVIFSDEMGRMAPRGAEEG